MSRLNITDRVPSEYNRQNEQATRLVIQNQLNNLSEGVVASITNAATAVPASGSYNQGDFVKNSAPTELGTAGNKYIIDGWQCVAGPLTFVQCRYLTGN